MERMKALYKVGHQVADLGWVDFVFGCSAICQILLGKVIIRQYWHSSRARCWNSQDHIQPNPGPRPDASPCICGAIFSK